MSERWKWCFDFRNVSNQQNGNLRVFWLNDLWKVKLWTVLVHSEGTQYHSNGSGHWLWHFWGMCNDIMTGLVWDNHTPVIVMTYDSGLRQTNDSCHEHESVCSRLVGFNLKIRKAPVHNIAWAWWRVSKWEPQGLQVFRKDGCYFYFISSTWISQISPKKSLVVFEVWGIQDFPDSKNWLVIPLTIGFQEPMRGQF